MDTGSNNRFLRVIRKSFPCFTGGHHVGPDPGSVRCLLDAATSRSIVLRVQTFGRHGEEIRIVFLQN